MTTNNTPMKVLFVILFLFQSIQSLAQDLNFRLDSCKQLVYKKTKGYSLVNNEKDSFYIIRKYFQNGFIIDQHHYYNRESPDKIDTLLRMEQKWLIKKGGKWQTYFDVSFFAKRASWRVVDLYDCHLYIPIRIEQTLKSRKYIYKEEYCEDLGNNLDVLKTFDVNAGIVRTVIRNNLVYELVLKDCN